MKEDNLGTWPKGDKTPEGYKRCSGCGEAKILDMFNNDTRTKDGFL